MFIVQPGIIPAFHTPCVAPTNIVLCEPGPQCHGNVLCGFVQIICALLHNVLGLVMHCVQFVGRHKCVFVLYNLPSD